ncbi:hypothetical protein SEA_CLUBPENGUIN_29 [Streptomyces phage ClubPenguin]|nr:hypothetical protein SEA_CLUBPENGUIN_29 [Streptomyces phage ClubPenguin]
MNFRFEKILKNDPSALEEEIHRVLAQMAAIDDAADEKYKTLNDQLKQLHAMKEAETSHKRISRDQLLAAGVHLVGIAAIINYERIHVITSKAGSMVLKSFK